MVNVKLLNLFYVSSLDGGRKKSHRKKSHGKKSHGKKVTGNKVTGKKSQL